MYTELQLQMLNRLLGYSKKYQISIQFWPEHTAVYISKDGVDLTSFGGNFYEVTSESISYLDRITKTKPSNPL